MGRVNIVDVAKQVCLMLENEKFSKSTPYIFATLSLERPFGRYRKILQRLADRGILEREGTGKFRWRLVRKDWNRDNPFRTAQFAQPPVTAPKPPELTKPPVNVVDYGPAIEGLKKRMESLEAVKRVELVIKTDKGKELKHFKERTHPIFDKVLFHINCGDNVMLVGPKGCGKTYLAQQLADALNRKCGIFPISGGVTEGKLFGRMVPNINTGKSEYQETLLIELFEKGGVALIDEVDAGDPNVLISLNSALANGVLTLDRPKKPTAERHEDFVCVAAANTWGNGADRQYVGRNQLDSAFVERFVQIEMDYDRQLERALCKGGDELVDRMHTYRDAVVANRLERTISTRLILRAYNWLQHGKNLEYIDELIFGGWRADEIRKVKGG